MHLQHLHHYSNVEPHRAQCERGAFIQTTPARRSLAAAAFLFFLLLASWYNGRLPLQTLQRGPSGTSLRLRQWDKGAPSVRALLLARMPLCLCCERGSRCRTLAAVNSLEYLIGHSAPQSRSVYSWLSKTRRRGGAKLESRAAIIKWNSGRTLRASTVLQKHVLPASVPTQQSP